MTKLILTLLTFLPLSPAFAVASCKMDGSAYPTCFQARLTPVVKVVIVAYGAEMKTADVLRVENLFKERFNLATEGKLTVEIVDRAVVNLKDYPRDLSPLLASIKGDDSRRTAERLTRLWYYYQKSPERLLVEEIHSELKVVGMGAALAEADAVLVMSGPQFEGLGFADGGYGLTEQPSEIAWALSDGGTTVMNTDEKIVDELLHEMGHLMGLDHASKKCYSDGMSGMATVACCNASPGSQDVMSYCRDRSRVRGPYYFRYTQCTKDYLNNTTVPALLGGLARPFQTKACD